MSDTFEWWQHVYAELGIATSPVRFDPETNDKIPCVATGRRSDASAVLIWLNEWAVLKPMAFARGNTAGLLCWTSTVPMTATGLSLRRVSSVLWHAVTLPIDSEARAILKI
jgi:hypothetical protein